MTEISKDTLWKGIIEDLFEDFCHYFFPDWAKEEADFSKNPEFLDKELDEIYPEKSNQKRFADKLVKIYTKNAGELWILIHIEVQGYQDINFAERMFTYFYRIRDRYQKQVMALVILTDENPNFLSNHYQYQYQQTKNSYEFQTFKLLNQTEEELNLPDNPFSIVMLTAKKALDKKNWKDEKQLIWKKDLVLALKNANYAEQKIRRILNFIRFYVKFNEEANFKKLDKNIQETFKQRKNMGIEEAILQEVKENGVKEGLEQAKQELEQVKITSIQRLLKRKKLSPQEIAEDFNVTLKFVLKIQRELK